MESERAAIEAKKTEAHLAARLSMMLERAQCYARGNS
jgi:hypothetical protein